MRRIGELVAVVLFLSVFSHAAQVVMGPSNTDYSNTVFGVNCKACSINCMSSGLFSSCPYTYFTYGCKKGTYCLSWSAASNMEYYAAVNFCLLYNGCQFKSDINSFAAFANKTPFGRLANSALDAYIADQKKQIASWGGNPNDPEIPRCANLARTYISKADYNLMYLTDSMPWSDPCRWSADDIYLFIQSQYRTEMLNYQQQAKMVDPQAAEKISGLNVAAAYIFSNFFFYFKLSQDIRDSQFDPAVLATDANARFAFIKQVSSQLHGSFPNWYRLNDYNQIAAHVVGWELNDAAVQSLAQQLVSNGHTRADELQQQLMSYVNGESDLSHVSYFMDSFARRFPCDGPYKFTC